MNYTTQMDAAKKKIVTKEMQVVAEKENMDVEVLRELVATGQVAIPANKNHKSLSPVGISKDCPSIDKEMEKVKKAIEMKTEAIMDLSNYGKTEEFRKRLVESSSAMIGTVPIYDAIGFYDKEIDEITVDEFFRVVEKHA